MAATHRPVTEADRERAAQLLTHGVGDGRISLSEFDTRVTRAYAATSRDELDAVVGDLTAPAPVTPHRPMTKAKRGYQTALRIELAAWLGVGLLNLIIWAAVSLGVGELVYFWPIWVIGPWGLVVLARSVVGPWRLGPARC